MDNFCPPQHHLPEQFLPSRPVCPGWESHAAAVWLIWQGTAPTSAAPGPLWPGSASWPTNFQLSWWQSRSSITGTAHGLALRGHSVSLASRPCSLSLQFLTWRQKSASTGLGSPACCQRLTWTPPLGWNNPLVDYHCQTACGKNDRIRHVNLKVLQFGALLTLIGNGRVIPKRESGFQCKAEVTEFV